MDASVIDKAVELTKQFIEAATPIAKQAYEIGLVTLRIDAAQTIVLSVVFFIASFFVLRRIRSDWREASAKAAAPENARSSYMSDTTNHLLGEGIPHFFAAVLGTVGALVSALLLANVWLWVKLISPELWLAHKAIEKIIN